MHSINHRVSNKLDNENYIMITLSCDFRPVNRSVIMR